MTKPLRQAMPHTAAFIDAMRDAFGVESINAAIKAGIDGQPVFWAKEGGAEIGTRIPYDPTKVVAGDQIQIGPLNPDQPPAPVIETRKGKRRG